MFIKLSAIIILLEVTVGQIQNHDWDLAVVVGNEIKLISKNGTLIEAATHEFEGLKAITYDSNRKQFLVSDESSAGDTIYALQMSKETDVMPIIHELPHDIQGLTVDPVEDRLYWADSLNKSINSISLNNDSEVEVFMEFDVETPQDILIDSCNRVLYWTNSNRKKPTIESATLEDRNRTVLVSTELYRPMGITIDHYNQRIYWADISTGIYFKIESISLDGTDRQLLYKGTHQKPFGLAVVGDYVYWTDHISQDIWRKSKNDNSNPTHIASFRNQPKGLTSRTLGFLGKHDCTNIQTHETTTDDSLHRIPLLKEEQKCFRCLNDGLMNADGVCVCKPGFRGEICQVDTCYNHCVHGTCVPTQNTLKCHCFNGYSGSRCERSICENVCLNDGQCSIYDGKAECKCPHGTFGTRCEIVLNNLNLTQPERISENILEKMNDRFNDPIFIFLIVCIAVLIIIIVIVGVLYMKKQGRPRIKKRIVVNKNITPLAYTPQHPPTTQCEITIENCCNMNLCETPCFEPPITFGGSVKDEKKKLLSSMEQEQLY